MTDSQLIDMARAHPRIGLYGGAFNPPHFAHVLVAAWALASGEIDELWIIPTGGHPFGKPLAPWDLRLEMCWRAFACFGERMSLLDIEKEPRTHYSIDTVRVLADQVPGARFRWVMGSDTFADAPKWKQFDELMRLAPPLLIPRKGCDEQAAHTAPGSASDAATGALFALPNVSSSWVREKIAADDAAAVAPLLPGGVLELIRQSGLYR